MSSFYNPQQYNQFAQPGGGFARPLPGMGGGNVPSRPFQTPAMGTSYAPQGATYYGLPGLTGFQGNPEPSSSPGPGMAYDGAAQTSEPPAPPPPPSGGGGNQGTNTGQNMSGMMGLNPQDIDASRFGGGTINPAMQSAAVQMGMVSPEQLRLLSNVRSTGGRRGEFARQMQRQFARMDARNRLRKRQRDAGFRMPRGQVIYD